MPRRRKYELKVRAEGKAETRQRIVEAAAALHETLGPANTPLSAVAERAGVQRLTLYRHFPDELALLRACGAHYRALHPPPEVAAWAAIEAREQRLTTALGLLYPYFRETAAMWANVLRDAEVSETVREASEPRRRYITAVRESLEPGWKARDRRVLCAAIGLAVDFRTWSSLHASGLPDAAAIDLMLGLVRASCR